jgi:hypothetical protein
MPSLQPAAPRPSSDPGIEYLTVADVAKILAVSDDTILKQFGALDGVIDIGTPGGMHRRRKRVLRISRRTLEAVHRRQAGQGQTEGVIPCEMPFYR